MTTKTYGQILLQSGKRPKAAYELLQKAAILLPDDAQVAQGLEAARDALANTE